MTYDTGAPGEPGFFQTEVTLLEKTPEHIHLAVAVSDGGVSRLAVEAPRPRGPEAPRRRGAEAPEPSVTRAELRERLRAEVVRWEQKGFQDLAALTYPVTYDTGAPGEPAFFQTEVTLLEQTPEYVHLVVAVSDGGVSAFVPVAEDVMVRASGPG